MGVTGFEFATATRIVFGAGRLAEAPEAVKALGGRKVLLVTGRTPPAPGRCARDSAGSASPA